MYALYDTMRKIDEYVYKVPYEQLNEPIEWQEKEHDKRDISDHCHMCDCSK